MNKLGQALAEIDRVRFLSPTFHSELVSEIRWSKEEALARRDGLDVASLELSASDLAALQVVRSSDAMAVLRTLDKGHALGNSARKAFGLAAAALVLTIESSDDFVEGGRGLERLWLAATRRGIAVHPWGSPFVFQRLVEAPDTLDEWERGCLSRAMAAFDEAAPLGRSKSRILVLRLSRGAQATARSLRRPIAEVLTFDPAFDS